jgi:CAAX protease family protein
MMPTSRKKILVFLFLTLAFASVFYYLAISSGDYEAYTLGLMWCPGVAAMLTQLFFQRSLRGLGWRLGQAKYWLLGYGLPVIYGGVVYGIVWLTGLGRLVPFDQVKQMNIEVQSPVAYVLLWGTIGLAGQIIGGLGEEIGWRGLLVPELSKETSFTVTALVSGGIWAIYHYPLILFSNYGNSSVPAWFGLICFTVLVIGSSFVYAWLRLASGSIWPAVILHASHNQFIKHIFTAFTGDTGITAYVIDELGIALALAAILIAYLFWRRRGQLPTQLAINSSTSEHT